MESLSKPQYHFLQKWDNPFLKVIWNLTGPPNSQNNLEKGEKNRRLIILDSTLTTKL